MEEEQTKPTSEITQPDEPTITRSRSVRTKVPEVEINVYRQGSPIAVFKANLGGWDQDQIEYRGIQYRFLLADPN